MSLQKAGGIAAFIEALAYIVGFLVMATVLNPGSAEGWTAADRLAFLLERKGIFQALIILIYVVFGVALVVLAVALHERLQESAGALMRVATPFAFIWAGLVIASGMVAIVGVDAAAALHATNENQAVANWQVIGVIQDGLGGGVEVVGGIWVLLITVVSLRTGALSKTVSVVGGLVGVAGILTIVPPLGMLGAVFGLGQIVWFILIGLMMFSANPAPASIPARVN